MTTRHRIGAIAGLAAPLSFAATVIVAGATRADYSHYRQFISEMGETGGENSWIMNIFGFATFAVLSAIFFLSRTDTLRASERPTSGRVAVIMSLIMSIGIFGAALFPCDTGCTPANPTTAQLLHSAFSSIGLMVFILAIPVWLYDQQGEIQANPIYAWYSIGTAASAIICLALMITTTADRAGTGLFRPPARHRRWPCCTKPGDIERATGAVVRALFGSPGKLRLVDRSEPWGVSAEAAADPLERAGLVGADQLRSDYSPPLGSDETPDGFGRVQRLCSSLHVLSCGPVRQGWDDRLGLLKSANFQADAKATGNDRELSVGEMLAAVDRGPVVCSKAGTNPSPR